MKSNEEFRASVFAKAAAYEENRKKKRRERTRRAFALALCALIAVPIIYLPLSLIPGNTSTAGTTAASTIASTTAAPGTFNTTGAVVGTRETSAQTTVNYTETQPATNTTADIFIPDISAGDMIFCNGAFSYKTEYEGGGYSVEYEYYYYPYSLEKGKLSPYAKNHIHSSFLYDSALIVAKITTVQGIPILESDSFGNGAGNRVDATVRLVIEEGKEYSPSTWIILIPIPKRIAVAEPDFVNVYVHQYHLDN